MGRTKPLDGKLVLVTGASRGLGRALALAAADAGASLVLIARTVGALEEVDDEARRRGAPPATLVPLDLNEGDPIDHLGAALYKRFGKLDGLVVAHGTLGQLSPLGHVPPEVWAETLQVNTTAVYRLIRSLDPLLGQAEAPRSLFIGDDTGLNRAYWSPYAASKRAMEALVESYAAETRAGKVRVNLAFPPAMATRLRSGAYPGEDQSKLPRPEAVAPFLLPLIFPDETRHGLRLNIPRDSVAGAG